MRWGLPGKIRVPCMIRGVSAAKSAPPWQDMRAMHSRTALCSAFRMHGAHILPKPAHFGCTAAICCQGGALFPSEGASGMHEEKNLPRQGVRERIAREYCHGRPPGNVPRRNIAAVGRWGTQFPSILPSASVRGTHRGWGEGRGVTRRSAAALSPQRQKKASVLLAFFRCLVLRLERPGPSK